MLADTYRLPGGHFWQRKRRTFGSFNTARRVSALFLMDSRTTDAEPRDADDVFDSYMQSSRPSATGPDDDSGADNPDHGHGRLRRHSSDAIMEHQGAASEPPRRTRRHSADAIMQKSPEETARRLQLEPSSCAALSTAGLWGKALGSVGKSQRTSCPTAGGAAAPSAAGTKCKAALFRGMGDMGRKLRLDADARRYGGSRIDFTADADDSAQRPGTSAHADRHITQHSSAQNGYLPGAPHRRRTVSSPDVLAAFAKTVVQARGSSPRKHDEELLQEHEETVSIPIFHVHPSHPDFVPPVRELHLPSSTAYTLAVLGPMLLPWHRPSDTPWYTQSRPYAHTAWIVFQRSYLVLICAWCLQLGMLGVLFSEISDSDECAPPGDVYYLLKLIYISVYTGYILTDVIETVSMFEWIQHAPNATEVSTIELRRTVQRSSRQVRPRPPPAPSEVLPFSLSLFLSTMVVQYRLEEARSVAARRVVCVRMRWTTTPPPPASAMAGGQCWLELSSRRG